MSAAVAGTIGPVLFGSVLLALSVLEYDFMLGIGWRPVANPAGAWPSGLALGPYGLAQVANFVLSGLLLAFFSLGIHLGARDGHGSPLGPAFPFVAGTAEDGSLLTSVYLVIALGSSSQKDMDQVPA